jgi:glycine hydroxymethyltransferase
MKNLVLDALKSNFEWRSGQCLNLLAAESFCSPLVRVVYGSDLMRRTNGGHVRGNRFINDIEAICTTTLKELFEASFVNYKPLGGVSACHIVYASICKSGDTIMSLSEAHGGDPVHRENGAPGVLGLKILDIPFDIKDYSIDLDQLEKEIEIHRPKVLSVGQSNLLHGFDISRIASKLKSHNGLLFIDASHELGLIAGKVFPNPLHEGADIMVGTTGKTFSGPPGGLICWNDPILSECLNHMSSVV